METETPFNSIGSDGARLDAEAFALLTVPLVTVPKAARATATSPAANPTGAALGLTDALGEGLGLGLGLGLGVGLTFGLGVAVGLATGTGIRLAPVNKVRVPIDSVVMVGDNS